MTTKPWLLSPNDVCASWVSSQSGGRKRAAQSRVLDQTSAILTLTHKPTGITVSGQIALGHYSRTAMKDLRQGLYDRLLDSLQREVARHLRIAGR